MKILEKIIKLFKKDKEIILDKFAIRDRNLNTRYAHSYHVHEVLHWPLCTNFCSDFNFAENDVSVCTSLCFEKLEKVKYNTPKPELEDMAVSFDGKEIVTYKY